MSFLLGRGKEARSKVEQSSSDYGKMLLKMKSGETVIVRVKSDEDYAGYEAHSVHKVFYTTPCARSAGIVDLYDKAAELLFKDARDAEKAGASDDEVKKMRQHAGKLLPKGRYLFAFFDLDTGNQILVDMTANQGKDIIASIEKNKSRLETFAFELSRVGESTDSRYVLTPYLDDLTPAQKKNFDAVAEKEVDEEAFEKVFQLRDKEGQIEDLRKFGFDVTRLGEEPSEKQPAFTGEDDELEPFDPSADF